MKAYEVIVDGEVIHATVDESLAKATAQKWNKHGHLATYREQVVPTELSDLVSLCHRMNIERARGRRGVERDVFAEIMAICGKCKP
jgi:hypothetical protein